MTCCWESVPSPWVTPLIALEVAAAASRYPHVRWIAAAATTGLRQPNSIFAFPHMHWCMAAAVGQCKGYDCMAGSEHANVECTLCNELCIMYRSWEDPMDIQWVWISIGFGHGHNFSPMDFFMDGLRLPSWIWIWIWYCSTRSKTDPLPSLIPPIVICPWLALIYCVKVYRFEITKVWNNCVACHRGCAWWEHSCVKKMDHD